MVLKQPYETNPPEGHPSQRVGLPLWCTHRHNHHSNPQKFSSASLQQILSRSCRFAGFSDRVQSGHRCLKMPSALYQVSSIASCAQPRRMLCPHESPALPVRVRGRCQSKCLNTAPTPQLWVQPVPWRVDGLWDAVCPWGHQGGVRRHCLCHARVQHWPVPRRGLCPSGSWHARSAPGTLAWSVLPSKTILWLSPNSATIIIRSITLACNVLQRLYVRSFHFMKHRPCRCCWPVLSPDRQAAVQAGRPSAHRHCHALCESCPADPADRGAGHQDAQARQQQEPGALRPGAHSAAI